MDVDEVIICVVIVVMDIVGGMLEKISSGVNRKLLLILKRFDRKFIVLFMVNIMKILIGILVMGRYNCMGLC